MDDPEWAEGFKWTCCEVSGDSTGCILTKHSTKPPTQSLQRHQSRETLGHREESNSPAGGFPNQLGGDKPKRLKEGFDRENPITFDD